MHAFSSTLDHASSKDASAGGHADAGHAAAAAARSDTAAAAGGGGASARRSKIAACVTGPGAGFIASNGPPPAPSNRTS